MSDKQLPRLVTGALFVLTAIALVGVIALKARGVETNDLTAIAAGGLGALAGFVARGMGHDSETPESNA